MNAERVKGMERRLNACAAATTDLTAQLDRMEALHDDMINLFSYYGSDAWYEDRECEGIDFPAGVLSEDAVYDEITSVRDAALQMLELATDILKNRI